MTRYLLCSILTFAILVAGDMGAQAQLMVGAKTPPLIPPTFLVSYMPSETQMLELDIAYQSSRQSSIWTVGVSGKLFLDPVEVVLLSIAPFLGVGVSIALISVHVLGQTSSIMAISVNVLIGAEHRISEFPVDIFAEIRNSISLSLPGVGVAGALGVRLEL